MDRSGGTPVNPNANARCQKCLQPGHWTFDCQNERIYKPRPTRTALLSNPALKLPESSLPAVDLSHERETAAADLLKGHSSSGTFDSENDSDSSVSNSNSSNFSDTDSSNDSDLDSVSDTSSGYSSSEDDPKSSAKSTSNSDSDGFTPSEEGEASEGFSSRKRRRTDPSKELRR